MLSLDLLVPVFGPQDKWFNCRCMLSPMVLGALVARRLHLQTIKYPDDACNVFRPLFGTLTIQIANQGKFESIDWSPFLLLLLVAHKEMSLRNVVKKRLPVVCLDFIQDVQRQRHDDSHLLSFFYLPDFILVQSMMEGRRPKANRKSSWKLRTITFVLPHHWSAWDGRSWLDFSAWKYVPVSLEVISWLRVGGKKQSKHEV